MRGPLLHGLVVAGAGYYPKATGHLRRRPKGTEQAIFIYCVKGAGWCEMQGLRHRVEEGDLLVAPPLVPHSYGADERNPWSIRWFHAMGANVPAYLEELGVSAAKPVVRIGEDVQAIALFEEIQEIVERDYAPVDLLHASHALAHLIGLMVRHRHERWHEPLDNRQKVSAAIAFMRQHLDKPLRVASLGALANLSASHFTALFKEQTGLSPLEYLTRLRMHRACQLLDNTALSVKEVAMQLGYHDQFHFSRMFKAAHTVAPTQYRAARLSGRRRIQSRRQQHHAIEALQARAERVGQGHG